MITKISTGNTLHSLMCYIYVTNEYGKPTSGSIDIFIESFGAIIRNGNLSSYITETTKVELDKWWSKVEQDLVERNLHQLANHTGGYEWFKTLCIEAKKLDNETKNLFSENRQAFEDWIFSIEVEENTEFKNTEFKNTEAKNTEFKHTEFKHTEFKNTEFKNTEFKNTENECIEDKIEATLYKENSSRKYKLYFENTPELIKIDDTNRKYIDIYYHNRNGANASGILYEDGTVLIYKGAKINRLTSGASDTTERHYTELVSNGTLNNLELVKDVIFYSVNRAGSLLSGGSGNPWWILVNSNNQCIDIYRNKNTNKENEEEDMAAFTLYFKNTPELIKIDDNGREYIEIRMNKSKINANGILYEDNTVVIKSGSSIGIEKDSISDRIVKKIRELRHYGYIDGYTVTKDIICKSPSQAGEIIYNGSLNGWMHWVNEYGHNIDNYRFEKVIENKEVVPKQPTITLSKYAQRKETWVLDIPGSPEITIELDTKTSYFRIHKLDNKYNKLLQSIEDLLEELDLLSFTEDIMQNVKIENLIIHGTNKSAKILFNITEV